MILLATWVFRETFCQTDSVIQTKRQNIATVRGTSTADWSVSLFRTDGILKSRIQVFKLFVS